MVRHAPPRPDVSPSYHHHLFSGFILVWDDTLRYFLNGIKIILQLRIISIVTGYNNSGLGDLQMLDIKLNITQPSRHSILKSWFLCELRVYFVNAIICLCRDGFYNRPQFIATISQQFWIWTWILRTEPFFSSDKFLLVDTVQTGDS